MCDCNSWIWPQLTAHHLWQNGSGKGENVCWLHILWQCWSSCYMCVSTCLCMRDWKLTGKKKPSLLFYSMHVLAFKNALMCWTLMCPTISVSCLTCSLALVKAALCVPAHEWLNWVPVRAADCWALTLTHAMIILAADIMVLLCYH